MKQRICVSVGKRNLKDSLATAIGVAGRADVIEIRLDLIEDPAVLPFLKAIHVPLLFTNRALWESGNFRGEEDERIAPLLEAVQHQAGYVDLEIMAPQTSWTSLLRAIDGKKTRIIASWYEESGTPAQEDLLEKLQQMYESGAHIGKIITKAHDYHDVLRVLNLQERAAVLDFPLIAFCVGSEGVMSRVATVALGGYMTYCSPDDGEVGASGQLMLFAMHTIYRLLGR